MITRRYWICALFMMLMCSANWILSAPSNSVTPHLIENDRMRRYNSTEYNPTFLHTTAVKTQRPIRIQRSGNVEKSTGKPDNEPESQNFFQSFAPLFGQAVSSGHSRPLVYPDQSYKSAFKTPSYRELPFTSASDNILGSGNFGVVKGGTYYAEEREDADFTSENEPYTYLGSTHGRIYKKNPPPAFRNGGDFFAHFRDFADITAPSKSYSQYYVVYVNKNATVEDTAAKSKQPKNIIEQLTMLDEEPKANESKQSKFKRKLTAHQRENEQKKKLMKRKLFDSPKEITEPLLAVS